jgi:hypothetical protein
MAKVKMKETTYRDYGKCMELTNGSVDLIVTLDTGPRIIRYGLSGQPNEFCDDAPLTLDIEGKEWRLMGGHRLWHSPEAYPRTYWPDNDPVEWEKTGGGIRVLMRDSGWVQVDREMEITLSPSGSGVKIVHTLTNRNAWPVEMAAWALTVMAPGGIEIIPQPQHESHFSDGAKGSRVITLWSYAKTNDPRVHWGDRYITVGQDPDNDTNIKFGISNEDGWAAYLNRGRLFAKKYAHEADAVYPDRGVSYETFVCNFMLEMESLSPLVLLEPDGRVSHIEEWRLFEGVDADTGDEKEIDRIVEKHISSF